MHIEIIRIIVKQYSNKPHVRTVFLKFSCFDLSLKPGNINAVGVCSVAVFEGNIGLLG